MSEITRVTPGSVAARMSARRRELIARPLAEIWEDLAKIAIEAAAPPMPGWEPISTAPKDGRQVLTRSDNGVRVARYENGGQFRGWFIPLEEGVTGGCFAKEVTHWMRLPAPPEPSEVVG